MNRTNKAATEIVQILSGLPSPREAASALATVRASLWLLDGVRDSTELAKRMSDDDTGAIEIWETICAAYGGSRK